MSPSRLVYGVAFIGLGVVLLLDRSGAVDAGQVLADWWPVLVIVAGVGQLVFRPRNLPTGAFVSLMGVALLLWSLAGFDAVSVLWPLVLVAIGLTLLTRRHPDPEGHHDRSSVVTDGELVAIFDDRSVRAPAGALAARSLTTIFGDLSLDLRDVVLDRRTTLQVVTIFGDVDLEVPADWIVTSGGTRILGDVRIPPPPAGATHDGIHLDVVTIFGDVEVRRTAAARERQER